MVTSSAVPNYVPLRLESLSTEVGAQCLYQEVQFQLLPQSVTSQHQTGKKTEECKDLPGKSPKQGFKFNKAISAIKSEEGCAVSSRGDGAFDDGSLVKAEYDPARKVKYVHLSPSALDASRADSTLKILDELSMQRGKVQPQQPASKGRPLSSHPKAVAPEGVLDLSEDRWAGAAGGVQRVLQQPSPAAASPSAFVFDSLPQPEHQVLLLGTDGGVLPPSQQLPTHIQVVVSLPGVESAAEADVLVSSTQVKVVVAGRFKLQVVLPHAVDDSPTSAKWSRTKHALTVTLRCTP